MYAINPDRSHNLEILAALVAQGYTDIGWRNFGSDFPDQEGEVEHLDCSLYHLRATNVVTISHKHRMFVHTDMSD